jgi:hypothetical protein
MIKSFYEYITENESDDPIIHQYVNDVINHVKRVNSTNNEYVEIRELEYKEEETFDLVIQVKKDSSPNFETDEHFNTLPWEEINYKKYGYAIDANTVIDKGELIVPEIILTLIIDPTREPDLYDELYYKLIDIITHELHHTRQVGWNREPFNVRPSSSKTRGTVKQSFEYFILPDEIESMVGGMYTRSIEQDIPIDELFNMYLIPFLKDKQLTQSQFEEVFKVWLIYSLENYPDARLNDSSPRVQNIIKTI